MILNLNVTPRWIDTDTLWEILNLSTVGIKFSRAENPIVISATRYLVNRRLKNLEACLTPGRSGRTLPVKQSFRSSFEDLAIGSVADPRINSNQRTAA